MTQVAPSKFAAVGPQVHTEWRDKTLQYLLITVLSSFRMQLRWIVTLLMPAVGTGFATNRPTYIGRPIQGTASPSLARASSLILFAEEESSAADGDRDFEPLTIALPPSGSGLEANLKLKPILSVPSEIVVVRYKLPFGLDVVPKNNLAVCTKDGAGGEKVGDVLRFTTQWKLGLPSPDSVMASFSSISGGVSWQTSLFNVVEAENWDDVVEALVSNVPVRKDCWSESSSFHT